MAVTISSLPVKLVNYHTVVDFKVTDGEPKPPTINAGNAMSIAMTKWVTPWAEVAYEKICYPKWDGVGQYTAQITNIPDFIKDYHFIALMRSVDVFNKPVYQGYITATTSGGPSPSTGNTTQGA